MTAYYTYHPEEFHYTGWVDVETQPENSTEVPAPSCDGERYAQWVLNEWVVKHLVDGVWVNCTDVLPLIVKKDETLLQNQEVIEEPIVEGDTNETI